MLRIKWSNIIYLQRRKYNNCSQSITTKLKPYEDREWLKWSIMKTAITTNGICNRIIKLKQNIATNLKKEERVCTILWNYGHSTFHTTGYFFRWVNSNFETEENLLSLELMHGTTRWKDLFIRLAKFDLELIKLSVIVTCNGSLKKG